MVAAIDNNRQEFYVGIYPPTGDYELLDNQPAIDGVTLTKNTTKSDLDLDEVFQYRGQVATYDDLPTSGLHRGDTYNVADTGENYAWNGSSWDCLTGTEAVYWRNGALESQGSPLTIDSDKNPITNLVLEDITDVTATQNEVNQLHEGTAVKADFIKLHSLTSTATEINQLHESSVETADLTKLHNVTADASELNILDGATLDTTELNYVDGVTSNIQDQLDSKIGKNTEITPGTHTKITYDAMGLVTAGTDITLSDVTDVTATASEVNYLSGATSNVQDQIDSKVAKNNDIVGATHTKITYDSKGLVTAGANLAESDIPALHLSKVTDVTATASEVNVLHGITADTNELNILDGATLTTTELNYVDGVTSAIQGQIGALTNLTTDAKNNLIAAINEVDSHSDTNASDILTINSKIPSAASDQNQLADKAFVNSAVSTATADFIGTFNSLAELEAYSGTLTVNDYAFVVAVDTVGNTVYKRYKWTGTAWLYEYDLNNSSFTADQWAAINSGATQNNTAQITTNKNAIGALSNLTTTADTNLVDAINELDSCKVEANVAITAATHTKITYDEKGLVTAGVDLVESDIPALHLAKITDVTATATELNYVDGVTSSIQDQLDSKVGLNDAITPGTHTKITYDSKGLITAGADLAESDIPSLHLSKVTDVTATATEVNILDGVTATTAELNILDGVTADASEINVLDGITATTTELNYVDGVTSSIQDQLDDKLAEKPDGTNNLIDNNKITTTYLPDYLLGQMIYAGTFVPSTATATLTDNAKSKLGTTSSSIVLTNDTTAITGYVANEGCYYICSADGTFAGLALLTGDWLLSTGTSWSKIDNTDAVTGIKGDAEANYRIGNVNITLDNVAPDQTGNSGKFITTDGTNVSWGNVPVSDVTVDNTSVVSNGVAVIPNASGSNYGVVKLTNSLLSISNTLAATPSAINTLYRDVITGANTFDKDLTYNVGDKVRYSTGYYECITAITTPHAWNESEWTQITIQGQIDEKVSDVTVNGTSIVNGTTKVATIPLATQGGDYGLIKLRSSAYGLGVDSSGYTIINRASTTDIDERTAYYKPITPLNLDYATIISLSDNKNALDAQDSEWTTARQFASRKWLGAMGSNIFGTSTTAAATVEKEVSIPSITELNAGQIIIVTPTETSTVANSTIKLNNFTAYPMLYGGNAITTSTDSYVWIANVPAWWYFDGSNWNFLGHGTDINTTYSSMTQANIIGGTETSGRLMRSDYLKNGIFGVVTAYNSGATIALLDKYLYDNSTDDITSLVFSAPTTPDNRYYSQVNFTSGSTATTLTYPSTFKVMEGCDDVQYINGVRTFVPVANKRYQVFITCDGVNVILVAKGV